MHGTGRHLTSLHKYFLYIIQWEKNPERVNGDLDSEWTALMRCDSLTSAPLRAEFHIIHFVPRGEQKHQPHGKEQRMSKCISLVGF